MTPKRLAPPWDTDERFRELVELAPDGIFIHDGEHIMMANAAAVRMVGASNRDEVVGESVETFFDPPYLRSVQLELTEEPGVTGPAPPVRDTMHCLDGTDVEVEVRAIAFLDNGRPSAHLVVRDVTERLAVEEKARAVEQRLQQAQRMEVVGALAGGMAHEINNMMSVVLGFGEFLTADVALPPHCLGDVREIMKAAERAAAVTRQLLAFSRRAVLRPQSVELATVVRELTPVLRRLLGENRQLIVASQPAPLSWIDPAQLQQVIINLALNARDAMPDNGTLTIGTGAADIPATPQVATAIVASDGTPIPAASYAILVVRDTGIGMDEATVARIFEPFFTTKPIGQGTGLGLAAAQGIVAESDGYITVASVRGEGTTFTIYLPAHRVSDVLGSPSTAKPKGRTLNIGAAVDDHPPLRARATPSGDMVLVVDDEPAVRSVAARILERSGYRVIPATDGVHALELIERFGTPDVVLTDMMMPGMGGAELARILRKRFPEIPVVFMSGYSPAELHRQGAVAVEGSMIQKPFTSAGLVRVVVAALARRDAAQPAT